jgi:hypothetical protein
VVEQRTGDIREYKGHVFQNVTQGIGIEWESRRLRTWFLLGNLQERYHLDDPDVEEIGWDKIQSRMNSSALEKTQVQGYFEHLNDTSGSRKCRKISLTSRATVRFSGKTLFHGLTQLRSLLRSYFISYCSLNIMILLTCASSGLYI